MIGRYINFCRLPRSLGNHRFVVKVAIRVQEATLEKCGQAHS